MADALASGASEGNLVGVQVPPRPLEDPCRTQLAISASTSPAVITFGIVVPCQPATGGIAAASGCDVKPFTNKKRSNARNSATRPFAEPAETRPHSTTKRPVTSAAARSVMNPSPTASTRSFKNRRAVFS